MEVPPAPDGPGSPSPARFWLSLLHAAIDHTSGMTERKYARLFMTTSPGQSRLRNECDIVHPEVARVRCCGRESGARVERLEVHAEQSLAVERGRRAVALLREIGPDD